MFFSSFFALLPLAAVALAAPTDVSLEKRLDTTSHCGQWDSVTAGQYSLLLDLWGKDGATSGYECANLHSLSGTTVSWITDFEWVGGNGIKGYTNMQLNSGLNKQLSAIKSMQSSWTWALSYTGSIVADVAYDIFTSATPGGANAYEIMIWMANYNAGPISYTYGASGSATPIQSNLSIAGQTWNLYYGSNGSNYVYSFLPTSGKIRTFSGDLKAFFTYLSSKGYVSSSQYLKTLQSGTEVTVGKGKLVTSSYSVVVA